ncbi:hypothetical protein [Ketogulonicigenium vulgare]|uniref:Lipoprotein n=1 Tax=Ketogulonicigenium vulgare (strain WSH-001) TaxID=759362 RepID=F9Y8I0_KETVW|nr:hypothetical protein [Ketogulonicigenium vulgare]ADO41756.1 hypothetical protein EIO_0594 [Ketogulonicigenium vulgare Y25]AEM39989.1 hypothetical protein KVU_0150 [Ketogulonicigenium vulgare WSH-001]ALJ80195.1 hypothetical protein KVH_02800 [Ketogulonicigenium vulgare]ANW34893.1 hypothetical protein KvSKV_02795 [Ketogulonicigenium vulgare]AOZ53687.1 hypothetical protein KVC_0663 [Ketogulonicigenium vulgare]
MRAALLIAVLALTAACGRQGDNIAPGPSTTISQTITVGISR